MNTSLESLFKIVRSYRDTITYLEGKLRGLQTLIGLISDEADEVIEKHKVKVRQDLDFAYDKLEQYEAELLDYERKKG